MRPLLTLAHVDGGPQVSSVAGGEAADEELLSFLQLIGETDGAVQDAPATRESNAKPKLGNSYPIWKNFYQKALNGKVTATMVIDFQYGFNKTVERMYCFDDGGASRVVIHVHTLELWPANFSRALAQNPATRARKVTSVNIRHATLTPSSKGGTFLQGKQGHQLVGVPDWKSLVSNPPLGSETETVWRWGTAGEVPQCQRQMGADLKVAYDEVRSEASLCLPFHQPPGI